MSDVRPSTSCIYLSTDMNIDSRFAVRCCYLALHVLFSMIIFYYVYPSGISCWETTCLRSSPAPEPSTFRYSPVFLSLYQPIRGRVWAAGVFIRRCFCPHVVNCFLLTLCCWCVARALFLGAWNVCFCEAGEAICNHNNNNILSAPPGRTADWEGGGRIRWEVLGERERERDCKHERFYLCLCKKKKGSMTNIQ